MKNKCLICTCDMSEQDGFETEDGVVCRSCINETCVGDLYELAGDESIESFAERVLDFIGNGWE